MDQHTHIAVVFEHLPTLADEKLETVLGDILPHPDDKEDVSNFTTVSNSEDKPNNEHAQAGVREMEAVTPAWTKSTLIMTYVIIFLAAFVLFMQQVAFVTSTFAQHSLTPTVAVLSSIIVGVSNLTLAKVLDVVGRTQGHLLSIILATMGLFMMAAWNSVEQYAAAEIFHNVGQNSLLYTLSIFIADTFSFRNRGLMVAMYWGPNIITTWISGPLSQAFLNGPSWPWAFGTFGIAVPVFSRPLYLLFLYNSAKAKKLGLVPTRASGRTSRELCIYHARETDAVGLLLVTAGMALFLLPCNIYTDQTDGCRSPLILFLLVFDVVLLAAFVLWEGYIPPVTLLPYALLTDRTVVGACLLGAVLFISYYCWASFFSSYLLVVNAYNVGSGIFPC